MEINKNLSYTFKSGDVVEVLLPIAVDEGYDYIVPVEILNVSVGDIVFVQLKSKKMFGVIWGPGKSTLQKFKIKPIIEVVKNIDRLNSNLLSFIKKVSYWTVSPLGNVLSLVIPNENIFKTEKKKKVITLSDNYVSIWNLSVNRKTDAKQRVIDCLKCLNSDNLGFSMVDLSSAANVSTSTIKSLLDIGLLKVVEVKQLAYQNYDVNYSDEIKLSDEQSDACKQIMSNINKFSVTLIDGVTGSGKTEVYFKVISNILKNDNTKQILILLPEISLTSQFLQKFKSRFGFFPTLWHSTLTSGQRTKNYSLISKGIAKIIVGARSALFLPYKNLSLVVVDEEHDGSYKQEEGVIYNARDMAVLRAKIENIPIILASATPSIESCFNVMNKKYNIVKLNKRFSNATLPTVELIDLKESENKPQNLNGEKSWLSPVVIRSITNEIIDGNQVLIFLNRRGYAPLLLCSKCGYKFTCPNCDASMVAHNICTHDQSISGVIKCHHCGYFSSIKSICPRCKTKDSFVLCGPGVDRIQMEIKTRFPNYNSFVMSSDTITNVSKLDGAISAIENHDIDIIIGTQILSKGHNFPNLTLVVIVDGDMGIAGDDFRGAEKTFAMLHQVSGRAGRYSKKGKVLIQTYNPDIKVMQCLKVNDKQSFIKAELENRCIANMPPFSRLCAIIISGKNKNDVVKFGDVLLKCVPQGTSNKFAVWGPVDAPIAYLNNYFRRRFLIVANLDVSVQKLVYLWLKDVKIPSNLKIKIDVDPYNFM